jgi:heat shock protein HslJ
MRIRPILLAVVLMCTACAHDAGPPVATTPGRITASLLNTYWGLTQLGDQQVATPADAREIHLVLHSANQRVSGFSGCNRITGGYVLEGESLRFDQMAGTLMACSQDMDLEKRFLAMFSQVKRWEISGETLRLLDESGNTLARLQARRNPPQ